jgi:hypothetical protein
MTTRLVNSWVFASLLGLMLCVSTANAGVFLDEWKQIKKEFETSTGKSKPSAKAEGFFRKKSGLEDALKNLEKAQAKAEKDTEKRKEYKTAVNQFGKVKTTYIKRLKEVQVESDDQGYKHAIDVMIIKLEDLEQKAAEVMNTW